MTLDNDSCSPKLLSDFICIRPALAAFLIINLLLGLGCGLLNGIAMKYYQSKLRSKCSHRLHHHTSDNINHVLYLVLSVLGLFLALGALLHCIILLITLLHYDSVPPALLAVSYIVIIIPTYVSVVTSICLSVVRTVSITHPLLKINTRVTLTCIVIYGIGWSVITGLDVYWWFLSGEGDLDIDDDGEGDHMFYYYSFINLSGGLGMFHWMDDKGWLPEFLTSQQNQYIFPVIFWGFPCALPALICFCCCVIQVVSLWSRSRVGRDAVNRRITITILLLTAVFITCNTLSSIFCAAMTILKWRGPLIFCLLYSATSILPFVNTFLNPVILIARGAQLRRYFGSVMTHRKYEPTSAVVSGNGAGTATHHQLLRSPNPANSKQSNEL